MAVAKSKNGTAWGISRRQRIGCSFNEPVTHFSPSSSLVYRHHLARQWLVCKLLKAVPRHRLSALELRETRLGNTIASGLAIFWLLRLGIQFFGYSTLLWKGKRSETAVHLLLSLLWGYLSLVFFFTAWPG